MRSSSNHGTMMRLAGSDHFYQTVTGGARRAARWRASSLVALACLLWIGAPARALQTDETAPTPALQPASTTSATTPDVSFALPVSKLSLSFAYTPSKQDKDAALKLQSLARRSLWMDFAPEPASSSQAMTMSGKGLLKADYAASAAMRLALSYENDYQYVGGRDKAGFSAEYTPSSRLKMALAYGYEGDYTELAAKGGKDMPAKTSYSYQLDCSPSALSKLQASWQSVETGGSHGAQGTTSRVSTISYEQKLTGGLLRVGQLMKLTSSGSAETRDDTSTIHLEWAAGKPFSLTADYSDARRTSGDATVSTIAAKYVVSPRLNLAFNLRDQSVTGQEDLTRSDIAVAANLGSKTVPLQMTATVTDVAQGDTPASAREVSFQTGVVKPQMNLQISGRLRDQEGALDKQPEGETTDLKVQAQVAKVQVTTVSRTLSPPDGNTQVSEQADVTIALTPTTQATWTSQRQEGATEQSREAVALTQRLGTVELTAGHEERDSSGGDLQWDTMQIIVKGGGALPPWAKTMDGTGLFDAKRHGYRTTPTWGATQPGLEVGWRKRSGAATADADSLRLVYRGMIGFVHLRIGQETNSWTQKGLTETVALGERRFTEFGVPLFGEKHAAIARFSAAESSGETGRETFLALRSVLSKTDQLECFVADETGQFQGSTGDPTVPTYGIAYSRTVSAQQAISLKASFNPPVVASQPIPDRWRLDLAYSKPF